MILLWKTSLPSGMHLECNIFNLYHIQIPSLKTTIKKGIGSDNPKYSRYIVLNLSNKTKKTLLKKKLFNKV